jgi:hypothetical protein
MSGNANPNVTLRLDHIFVCTDVGAPEARELLDAGFVEGTRNVHPGQGTSNRRFFFEHGFLELLWVHDESEATSALTTPTRLWERWANRGRHSNPFGICFSSTSTETGAPFPSWAYEPAYLPPGKRIHFAQGGALCEPELFVLGWPQPLAAAPTQPTSAGVPLKAMVAVSIGLAEVDRLSPPMRAARDAGLIRLHRSSRPELLIEFAATAPFHLHLPSVSITLTGSP